jgi:hypothetical protein
MRHVGRLKASYSKAGLKKPGWCKRGIIVLSAVFFILSQICGCGASSDDDSDDNNPDRHADIAGQWSGTTTVQNGLTYQTTFDLTQAGENISGTWNALFETESYNSEDVNGTVKESTVTISVVVREAETPDNYLEYVYSGTVDGSNISGDVTISGDWDGAKLDDTGSFSLSRSDDGSWKGQVCF